MATLIIWNVFLFSCNWGSVSEQVFIGENVTLSLYPRHPGESRDPFPEKYDLGRQAASLEMDSCLRRNDGAGCVYNTAILNLTA
jgi:hypothetical protein